MSKFAKYLFFLLPACLCEHICGKPNNLKPKVTIANSTHLRVSWKGVFTDCSPQDIRDTDVVSEHSDIEIGAKFHPADFEKREAFVELDPCKEHKIYLRIRISGGHYIESDTEKYNDARDQISRAFTVACSKTNHLWKMFALSRKK